MSAAERTEVFTVVERNGPGGRLVLRSEAEDCVKSVVVADYRGADLPAAVTSPVIAPRSDGGSVENWRLSSREGVFDFQARAVDRLEERPALYDALHWPFALSTRDRVAARALLLALRLPGGARLLRHWHARRSS
jgi:hypothetical protein